MAEQSKDLKAFKAGVKAKKDENKGKRRQKVYRIKKPTTQAKQAIGKFQHKHPYVSLVATGATLGPATLGVGAGIAQRAGFDAFRLLSRFRGVPVAGKIYNEVADATYNFLRRY